MKNNKNRSREILNQLVRAACQLGATAASAIAAGDIVIEENLAKLCEEPRCENFGQSPGCPPHVSGPAGFRDLINEFTHAVVFKIDVPTEILLSENRREVFRLLHEISAGLETAAVGLGCVQASAYAGGSCKQIFCHGHAECSVLESNAACRHPLHARPSMSGFGINVTQLMQTAGWTLDRITSETDPEAVPMGSLSGLVLVR